MSRKQRRYERAQGLQTRAAATAETPTRQRTDLTYRTFQIRAGTLDTPTRSVDAVLATEQPVMVFDWQRFQPIEEILLMDGLQMPDIGQVPMLDTHDRSTVQKQLGSTRNLRVENGKLIGRRFFSSVREALDAFTKVEEGHITDGSIGYRVTNHVDIEPGKTVEIAGRSFTASNNIVRRISLEWSFKEDSICPIGADDLAKFRQETPERVAPQHTESANMNPKLRTYLESVGLRKDATAEQATQFMAALSGKRAAIASLLENKANLPDDAQRAALTGLGINLDNPIEPAAPETQRQAQPAVMPTTTPAATAQPASNPAETEAARAAAVEAERTRIADIGRTITDVEQVSGRSVPDELRQRLLFGVPANGTTAAIAPASVQDASRALLEHFRTRSAPAGIAPHTNGSDAARALGASLMLRDSTDHRHVHVPRELGLVGDQRDQYQQRVANMSDRYRGMSLVDICRASLQIDGRDAPYNQNDMFEMLRDQQRSAGMTGTATNIFSTNFLARLIREYTEAPDTTEGWVESVDEQNFQTVDLVDFAAMTSLKPHARGGTAKTGTIIDAKESYKIARYSGMAQLDEQDIIDNNLRALDRIPREMGRAAARLRPDLIYALLLLNAALDQDGVTLFHATSHGGNSLDLALSMSAYATGVAKMAKQTKNNGTTTVNLNLEATHLIVPPDLDALARQITASPLVMTSEALTSGGVQIGTNNPNFGQVKVVKDNRIGVAGVTNPVTGTAVAGLATNWFLVSTQGPGLICGYRAGTGRQPQIRTFQLDKGQWGMGWDVNMDIGAKAEDYRTLMYSDGVP